MADIPLPLHSYSVATASTARLVNTFAESTPKGAKGPVILRRAPGIKTFCACGTGAGRGLHVMQGRLFAVTGPKLYAVNRTASVTELGSVTGVSSLVSAIDNGTQIAVSADGYLTVYDGASTLPVSDPDVPFPLGRIDFLDSYLLGIHEGTGQFVCSALDDFTDFDALDFATAEGAPDNLVTHIVDHRSDLLLGTETGELWDNSPDPNDPAGFPFSRVPNGFIEIGAAAKDGICKQDNSAFWLASDRTLRRLTGATPERVSQHGAEQAWAKYATVSDARCFPYSLDGHLCVVTVFPSELATWIYDCTTQQMHERESYPDLAWDISGIVKCYDRIFVQRASTGEIGVLDKQTYTEWGLPLVAQWAYQSIYAGGKGLQVHRLEMGIETGIGLVTGQGSDPRIQLARSKLGGRAGTFRSIASRSLGRQGDFKTKVHWDGLGTGPDNVFSASLSEPVPLTIWNTMADVEELAA